MHDPVPGTDVEPFRTLLRTERRVELLELWNRRQGIAFAGLSVVLLAVLGSSWIGGNAPAPSVLTALAVAAAAAPLLPLGRPPRDAARLVARLDRALRSREILSTWLELEAGARSGRASPFLARVRAEAHRVATSARGRGTPPPRLGRTMALGVLAAGLLASVLPVAGAARTDAGAASIDLETLLARASASLAAARDDDASVARARDLLREAIDAHGSGEPAVAPLEQASRALGEALAAGRDGETGNGPESSALHETWIRLRAATILAARQEGIDPTGVDADASADRPGESGAPRDGSGNPVRIEGDPEGGTGTSNAMEVAHPTGSEGSASASDEATPGVPPVAPWTFALPSSPRDERVVRAYFAAPRE